MHLGIDDGDLPAILAFEYDTNRKYLRTHVHPTDFPQFVKEFKVAEPWGEARGKRGEGGAR